LSHPADAFTGILHPDVRSYLHALHPPDDPLIERMETYAEGRGFPLIGREAGRWLELLTRMIGGRRVFEMGSGWGYSACFFARAVGADGAVVGSETDSWELDAHRELFDGHPLASRIRIVQGDAFAVLEQQEGAFDVIFLDLHKAAYPRALDAALPRLRSGGLLLADNVLWGGKTSRPAAPDDPSTAALREFNARCAAHPELFSAILPACDGLSVSLKR